MTVGERTASLRNCPHLEMGTSGWREEKCIFRRARAKGGKKVENRWRKQFVFTKPPCCVAAL